MGQRRTRWREDAPAVPALRCAPRLRRLREACHRIAAGGSTMKLDQAKALVTGGSSGIGYATAKLLRERGAQVAICGRDGGKLEHAARQLGAVPIVADVARE